MKKTGKEEQMHVCTISCSCLPFNMNQQQRKVSGSLCLLLVLGFSLGARKV